MTELEFTDLVRSERSRIYSVCYMFADDSDEAADLFQEVLINIWRGGDSFRGAAKVSSWVYRISLNTCISARRRSKKATAVRLDMDIDLYDDSDADSLQIQQLYGRIHRLGLLDRAIVLLWLESMTYDEIGEIVGLTAKNVGVRLARIRRRLREMTD